jgi:hypothetical protein
VVVGLDEVGAPVEVVVDEELLEQPANNITNALINTNVVPIKNDCFSFMFNISKNNFYKKWNFPRSQDVKTLRNMMWGKNNKKRLLR